MRRSLGIFIAWAVLFVPTAAYGDMETVSPEIDWGIESNAVIVQAPRHAWGTRRIMRYIDNQLPYFDVYFGKCSTMPDVPCLLVETDEYGSSGWFGVFTFTDATNTVRIIKYNESYIPSTGRKYAKARSSVSCHEVMHAFGMPHHDGEGCVSNDYRMPYPSALELDALHAYYG